jgi:hypothetical protein
MLKAYSPESEERYSVEPSSGSAITLNVWSPTSRSAICKMTDVSSVVVQDPSSRQYLYDAALSIASQNRVRVPALLSDVAFMEGVSSFTACPSMVNVAVPASDAVNSFEFRAGMAVTDTVCSPASRSDADTVTVVWSVLLAEPPSRLQL